MSKKKSNNQKSNNSSKKHNSQKDNYNYDKPSQAQELGDEWDDYAWTADDF